MFMIIYEYSPRLFRPRLPLTFNKTSILIFHKILNCSINPGTGFWDQDYSNLKKTIKVFYFVRWIFSCLEFSRTAANLLIALKPKENQVPNQVVFGWFERLSFASKPQLVKSLWWTKLLHKSISILVPEAEL